jgi:hypothetical protein
MAVKEQYEIHVCDWNGVSVCRTVKCHADRAGQFPKAAPYPNFDANLRACLHWRQLNWLLRHVGISDKVKRNADVMSLFWSSQHKHWTEVEEFRARMCAFTC